ncbi:MAG: GspE/PulE family protein, partial [Planctomycetota bacterium]
MRKGDRKRNGPGGSLSDLYTPEATGPSEDDDLGARLVEAGVVSTELVANAKRVLKQTPGKNLAEILSDMGAHEADVLPVVAEMARLPFERVDAKDMSAFDAKAVQRLGPKFCQTNVVLPLRREGSRLVVGTSSPHDVFVLDDVKRQLGVPSIKHVLVTAGDIKAVIDTLTDGEAEDYDVEEMLIDVDEDDVEVLKDQLQDADAKDADSSPVVRLVNHIIQSALKENASDIHIEPDERELKVRLRIDGVLFDLMNPPKKMHAAMTSRIKIMSNLDIAERRLPQDGRIRATVLGRKLDLRVSTTPTSHGEKTVMRILDNKSINVPIDQLGLTDDTLLIWQNQIAQPHGIILVPVEYNVSGITQIQVHDRIGMNFAAALRSMLRQDPDVILVGEIRDTETATIAIQAALTGHLVLSTLHTNDAPSSITRMINIGMEPFLVGAAVRSVLAQRLVRRVCAKCAEQIKLDSDVADLLTAHGITLSEVKQGKGCSRCRETGYSGRIGLYEMLVLDDFLRDAVARNPNVTEFRRVCTERGMVTLREDGFK